MALCLYKGTSSPFSLYPVNQDCHSSLCESVAESVLINGLLLTNELDDSVLACGVVNPLDWDTRMIGMPAGRIDHFAAITAAAANEMAAKLLETGRKAGIEHLSCRINPADSHLLTALESCGFETVDELVTLCYSHKGPPEADVKPGISTRLATPDDAEPLGDIGATAFSQDRFHDDPMLAPGVADELHREWAKNSIRGTAADAVIVGSVDGEIAGFVTCRLRHDLRPILGKLLGTIVLVATGPQYQGRGLGTAMTIAAMEWFALQKCDLVDVGTQAANKSAQGLYQKCGFVPVSNSITLRCAPFVPASAPTQTLVN